jgi:hypothetical protein
MVCAETGFTARAKPTERLVTMKARRANSLGGSKLSKWLCPCSIIANPSPPRLARTQI